MFPYQRFKAWQVSHELVLAVYQATQAWPKHELYGLTSQARRSAYSITMNLVEGSAKRGARDLTLLPEDKWSDLEELRNRAGQLLWRLHQAVAKRTQTPA